MLKHSKEAYIKQRAMVDKSMKAACRHYVDELARDQANVMRVARQFTLVHGVPCIVVLHVHIDGELPEDPEPRLFEYDVFKTEPFYTMSKLFTPTAKADLQDIVDGYDRRTQGIICTIITTLAGVSMVGFSVVTVQERAACKKKSKKSK